MNEPWIGAAHRPRGGLGAFLCGVIVGALVSALAITGAVLLQGVA